MIEIKFRISEVGNKVKLEATGGNSGRTTSSMERDFVKKLLIHINRFNTNYKNIHRGNRIKMRSTR